VLAARRPSRDGRRAIRGAAEHRVTVAPADGAPPVAGRAARGEHAV